MRGVQPLKLAGLFTALFLWFAAWGLIKPPFQAPDEFSHAVKIYAVTEKPLVLQRTKVRVAQKYLNPLGEASVLHEIPFHSASSISDADITLLKNLRWSQKKGEAEQYTTAFNYPFLYYLSVFVLGQGATDLVGASPYDSVYLYRLASSLLAALGWFLVYIFLPRELPYRRSVFLFIVMNPMLAFMSSSINPDVLFYPAVTLVLIGFYRLVFCDREIGYLGFAALVAAGLTKPPALVLFPTVALTSGGALFRREGFRFRRSLLVCLAALVVTFFGFYAWAPRPDHIAFAGIPVHLNLWEYFSRNHYSFLVKSYWGILGWLDYALPNPCYLVLYGLVAVNAALVLAGWREWVAIRFTWYSLLFSMVFAAGMFAVEYLMLPRYGFVLQGRYFLPVSIGLAMLLVHRHAWARYAFLFYLAVFGVLFFRETVARYYDGDWGRAWRALPFTSPLQAPESIEYQAVLPQETAPAVRIAGFLDDVTRRGNQLLLRGWSPLRDDATGVTIRIVTLVVPEKITGLRELRPDVAQALGDPHYLKSGFTITLDFADEEQARTSQEKICVTVSTGDQEGKFLLSSPIHGCRSLLREGAAGI